MFQHLEFIGRLYRVTDFEMKAERLLRQFDLLEKYQAGATTLSRGMRQKLAVCCAYLYDPEVVLLDEPLTGLDPPGIRTLLDSITDRANAGSTIIISSHLLAMIETICTDLIVMQSGRIQYVGEAARLRTQYPAANTLEQAYFAATGDQKILDPVSGLQSAFSGAALSLSDYQDGAMA